MTPEKQDGDKLAPNSDDDAIIAECKEFMKISAAADDMNRRNGLDALAFLSGDQWDPQAKAQRTLNARPCLTINKLPTFLHQVTNDQRQNVPGIKVHPVDSGSDEETAEILQGVIRHIEYATNADVAYDTAVNSAAAIGFGYFRLITQYCGEDTFDQEIAFKRIRNTFTVYYDPAATEPDGSDQTKCAISLKMPRTEFKRLYPDASASNDAVLNAAGDQQDWIDTEQVRITEYYRIEQKTATLILLNNGETGWKDEFDEAAAKEVGISIVKERQSAKKVVRWYKLTGTDVLERADIPCKWIPVFPVFGDEIDLDGRVQRSGLIKSAMDPAKMYNVWMTAATEEVALRPEGQVRHGRGPGRGPRGRVGGSEQQQRTVHHLQAQGPGRHPRTASAAPAAGRHPVRHAGDGDARLGRHQGHDWPL